MDTSPVGDRIQPPAPSRQSVEGSGWVVFAGIVIALLGVLNIIWGIAAIDKARFFIEDARFIISGLSTWGWIVLALGVVQIVAARSIWVGGTFGRWFGIAVAACNAIGALLTSPAYPTWAIATFALAVLVIYGLAAYGGDRRIAAG